MAGHTEFIIRKRESQIILSLCFRRNFFFGPFFNVRNHNEPYKSSASLISIRFINDPPFYHSLRMGIVTGKAGNLPLFIAGKGFSIPPLVLFYSHMLRFRVTTQAGFRRRVNKEIGGTRLPFLGELCVAI